MIHGLRAFNTKDLDILGTFPIIRNMSNNKNMILDDLADIFKALSNPNRLKIFLRLATCCTPGTVGLMDEQASQRYVGQLGEELDIVKSTVSHHMKELRRVGLIRMERQGQKIACWVDPVMLSKVRRFFNFGDYPESPGQE